MSAQAALITGGATRLGRHFAEALASAGYDIALHVNSSRQEAEQVAEGIRASGRDCEVFSCNFLSDAAEDDLVLVHDVARPCIAVEDLKAVKKAARDNTSGALLAMPVADTMKRAAVSGSIAHTESREGLWHALTPQGFRYGPLRRALEHAQAHATQVTDEASALEAMGESPQLISGRRDNIKVTHPDDLALADAILNAQNS